MDIRPYIIDTHTKIIDSYMDAGEYGEALEALGSLCEFYLNCQPETSEREW